MNNTNKSFELLKNVIAIQIRNWYDRSLENKHFNEIHEVFIKNKYDDISKSIDFIYDYSTHPDLFLGHTNGFIQIKLENNIYNVRTTHTTDKDLFFSTCIIRVSQAHFK